MSLKLPLASWGPLGHPPSPGDVHLGESLSHRKVPSEGTPAPPPSHSDGKGAHHPSLGAGVELPGYGPDTGGRIWIIS